MTDIINILFAFVFGAVAGSFLNVCIFRLPKAESVVTPPSHCPHCNYQIRWYDNIPVFSYLLLKGKCRGCKAAISIQYPLVELLNGFLTAALFFRFGLSATFAALFIFCSALVVITFIDLEHQIIPDEISLPGIILGFVFSFILPWQNWLNSLIGILLGGGSLLLVAWGYENGGRGHQTSGNDGCFPRLESGSFYYFCQLSGRLPDWHKHNADQEERLQTGNTFRSLSCFCRNCLYLLRP